MVGAAGVPGVAFTTVGDSIGINVGLGVNVRVGLGVRVGAIVGVTVSVGIGVNVTSEVGVEYSPQRFGVGPHEVSSRAAMHDATR
jgi:hypothetical protein